MQHARSCAYEMVGTNGICPTAALLKVGHAYTLEQAKQKCDALEVHMACTLCHDQCSKLALIAALADLQLFCVRDRITKARLATILS